MKLVISIFLALPVLGQISITASRQDPAVPRAYVGADIPKSLAVYLTQACNAGDTPATFYRDRITAEIAKIAPVQDGEAILYAARTAKEGGWKVVAYRIGGMAAMAAGGFASAGASTVLGQVAGGVGGAAGVSTMLKGRAAQLARLEVPENWWTADPTRMVSVQPGQCMEPMLLTLGQPADGTIQLLIQPQRLVSVVKDSLTTPPMIENPLISQAVIKDSAPTFTKPMITTPPAIIESAVERELVAAEEGRQHAEQVIARVREMRKRGIGAVE